MTPQEITTLSHKFIVALDGPRDRLYAAALAAAGAAPGGTAAGGKVETLLQTAIREVFAAFEKDSHLDPPAEVEQAVRARGGAVAGEGGAGARPAEGGAGVPAEACASMPADVWARLVATVQVEAVRSAHTRAINPDSVLLSPDPLLAPRKTAARESAEGLDLSPSSHFLLAGGIAVLVGIGLTVYLLTRPTSPPLAMPRAGTTSAPATVSNSVPTSSPAQ